MASKTILRIGHPLLRTISSPVTDFDTPELHALILDMFDTMHEASGAGLASVQIGVPLRVVICGFQHNPRYPDEAPIPETVLINPEIEILTNNTEDAWEGCLSVPGMRGLVPRYNDIRYRGFDQYGNRIDRSVSGFHSRVVQHECDHLDGILYPQRIMDLGNFGFIDELTQYRIMESACLPCETSDD